MTWFTRLGLDRFGTLHWALAVSVAVHAVLLTVRFVDPEAFNRVFHDTPLEVVLVNAKSNERPDKPQAVAQANLNGGGEAATGRATSPLPSMMQWKDGDAAENAEERKLQALKEQQELLIAQIRQQLAALVPLKPDSHSATAADEERERKRQQTIKLLAEIEKRVNEENARPRRGYLGPSTREEAYALYYEELRRKIEEHGTIHFPEENGKKLYGELIMSITVNHDGRVLETEIVQTSGKRVLDKRAQAIVQTLAFKPFSAPLRRKFDQLVVVSRFKFTRDDTLNATVRAVQ